VLSKYADSNSIYLLVPEAFDDSLLEKFNNINININKIINNINKQ